MTSMKRIALSIAAVAALAVGAERAYAAADTQEYNVSATLSSTLTISIANTLDCGNIGGTSANATNCGAGSSIRTGSGVTVTSFGHDSASITGQGTVTLTHDTSGDTITVDVNAYNVGDSTGVGATTSTIALTGSDTFYIFPDLIGGVDANDNEGNYTTQGTDNLTVTGT